MSKPGVKALALQNHISCPFRCVCLFEAFPTLQVRPAPTQSLLRFVLANNRLGCKCLPVQDIFFKSGEKVDIWYHIHNTPFSLELANWPNK